LVVTHRSPQDALEFGFDVQTWCKEGLVDAVAPSARWECTDSSIPVREWREIVGDDVALFPGVETLNLNWSLNEAEQTKAYAASFFAQGADGIRLNNHHDINDERNQSAWMINAENCLEGRRRFTVTYQDIASGSYPPFHPLPIRANDSIELELGKISEEDKVTVIIDFEGRRAPKLNVGDGDSLKPIQISDYYVPHENRIDEVNMIEHSGFSYDLTGVSTTSQLILDFSGKGTIHYIDIIIESQ